MSEQSRKDYRIEIYLLIDYVILNEEHWTHTEKHVSSEFLNKVKVLKNLI